MNHKNIEAFLQGRFELDCPKIEIIPCDTASNKASLTGSGFISINEDGHFDLKVYFPESFSIDETFESLGWESGKVISNEFYYNLVAHDISGNTWRTERFIPDRNSGPNGSIIIGQIPELIQREETKIDKNKHLLQLYFNETIKVPLNTVVNEQETVGDKTRMHKSSIRLARFSACNMDFEIDTRDGYTILSAATGSTDLSDIKVSRIFEAFRFVTAHTEPWSMLVIRKNGSIETRIRAVKNNKIKSRTPPPISYQRIQESESVWQLFECYLKFTILNDKDYYHPISSLFNFVLESGKASLDVEALTLSVSIESLLSDELCHLYEISPELKRNIQCASQLVMESGALDTDFRKRMLGSISAMNKARAKDILFVLRDSNLVDRDLVKTYGKVRNKAAHGFRDSGADIQNNFNQTSAVLVLFFQLIFLIIKYNGDYTDYGTYQYPTKVFSGKLP